MRRLVPLLCLLVVGGCLSADAVHDPATEEAVKGAAGLLTVTGYGVAGGILVAGFGVLKAVVKKKKKKGAKTDDGKEETVASVASTDT